MIERFLCRKEKAVVREFVSQLPDRRLELMLARAEAGEMYYISTDYCLLALAGSREKISEGYTRYEYSRMFLQNAVGAERSYYDLGGSYSEQSVRNSRLIAILKDVLVERQKIREFVEQREVVEDTHVVSPQEEATWTKR